MPPAIIELCSIFREGGSDWRLRDDLRAGLAFGLDLSQDETNALIERLCADHYLHEITVYRCDAEFHVLRDQGFMLGAKALRRQAPLLDTVLTGS